MLKNDNVNGNHDVKNGISSNEVKNDLNPTEDLDEDEVSNHGNN